MNDNNQEDKRNFSRIPFDSAVKIVMDSKHWESILLDISLKGALVQKPEGWDASIDDACFLEITLGEDLTIRMEAKVAHAQNDQIGFRCEHIDLESITHLRRLVELNTGDEELLARELHALTDA